MFIFKKLLTPFLLPPGIFVVVLWGAAAWNWRRRRRGTAMASLMLGGVLWALATGPVAERLLLGLERGLAIPRPLAGDVLILLGGGINDGVQDLTGRGTPTTDMLARVVTAVRAQRQLKVPIIVSGGVVFSGRSAEASIVRRFLVDLGVPAEQVLLEEKSRDTMENARYCREIIARHGFRRPLLVTSAYHMRRSLAAFRLAGVEVTPLPAQFATGSGLPPVWADWLPSAGGLSGSARALQEYLGLFFYRLTGG
jgi:uncharacterized SAM-binding protein YcdF (DUF218 family)